MYSVLATLTSQELAYFSLFLVIVFFGLVAACVANIWIMRRSKALSPYTHLPLRRGSEIPSDAAEKVLRFMYNMHQYDNWLFDVRKSAICRETGRIFPDALTWYNTLEVDWKFLQKRYPGHYVSWGSLTPEHQEILRQIHQPLDEFQTEFSSPNPQPRLVEPEYVYQKPGPLYVDLDKKVLLGWMCVPDTDFEVLVVQKPPQIITLSIPEKETHE